MEHSVHDDLEQMWYDTAHSQRYQPSGSFYPNICIKIVSSLDSRDILGIFFFTFVGCKFRVSNPQYFFQRFIAFSN